MPIVFIRKSERTGKKWVAILPLRSSLRSPKKYPNIFNVQTVHFGAKGYEDMTEHKDILRQSRYIARHIKNENWDDPNTAGFWSRWLLWNKHSLKESAKDIEKRFGIKVRFIKNNEIIEDYF